MSFPSFNAHYPKPTDVIPQGMDIEQTPMDEAIESSPMEETPISKESAAKVISTPIVYAEQIKALSNPEFVAHIACLHTLCLLKDPNFEKSETLFALNACLSAAAYSGNSASKYSPLTVLLQKSCFFTISSLKH